MKWYQPLVFGALLGCASAAPRADITEDSSCRFYPAEDVVIKYESEKDMERLAWTFYDGDFEGSIIHVVQDLDGNGSFDNDDYAFFRKPTPGEFQEKTIDNVVMDSKWWGLSYPEEPDIEAKKSLLDLYATELVPSIGYCGEERLYLEDISEECIEVGRSAQILVLMMDYIQRFEVESSEKRASLSSDIKTLYEEFRDKSREYLDKSKCEE